MIRLLDVRKGFNLGRPSEFIAVNGISLVLDANRVTVLKGPSGSGKTTLLSLIGCMARPTSGRVTLPKGLGGGRSFSGGGGRLPSGRCAALRSGPPRKWNGSPGGKLSGWRSPGR